MKDEVSRLVDNWSMDMQNSLKSSGLDMIPEQERPEVSETLTEGAWEYQIVSSPEVPPFAMVTACASDDEELVVPSEIGGMPVKGLGSHAFRGKNHLVRLELPDAVESLEPSMFSGCTSLREIHLPESLRGIPTRLLSVCPLEALRVPAATETVSYDAVNAARLKELQVAPGNARFSSDGLALYDADGSTLLRALVKVESYSVLDSCTAIGDGAFKSMSCLKTVKLNAGLRRIGDFAFFHTGLETLECPDTLESIGAKAFAGTKLTKVQLNDDLKSIGPSAFAQTHLTQVTLPPRLGSLGRGAFSQLRNRLSPSEIVSVSPDSEFLVFDGSAFYQRTSEGLELIEFLDNVESYEVSPEAVAICCSAFEASKKLSAVQLPPSLRRVESRAFYNCKSLSLITLPDDLELIGDSAFYNVPLESVVIGSRLEHIGSDAFAVSDGIMGEYNQVSFELLVSPDNEKFYCQDGLLIERGDDGDRVLLYTGSADEVSIPETVVEIVGGAFRNASVPGLSIPGGLKSVQLKAFFGVHGFEHLHLALSKSLDGQSETTLLFPPVPRDPWETSRTLALDEDGNFFRFDEYDSIAVHEQDVGYVVKAALSRLQDPIKLSSSARANYVSALDHYLEAAVEQFVEQDDIEGIHLINSYDLEALGSLESLRERFREARASKLSAFPEEKRGE